MSLCLEHLERWDEAVARLEVYRASLAEGSETQAEVDGRLAALRAHTELPAAPTPQPAPSAAAPARPPVEVEVREEEGLSSLVVAGLGVAAVGLLTFAGGGVATLVLDGEAATRCNGMCEASQISDLYAATIVTDIGVGLLITGGALAPIGLASGSSSPAPHRAAWWLQPVAHPMATGVVVGGVL